MVDQNENRFGFYLVLQQEAVCRATMWSQDLGLGVTWIWASTPNTLTFTLENVKVKVQKDGSEFEFWLLWNMILDRQPSNIWVNVKSFCEIVFVMKVGDYSFRRPSTTLLGMCSHGFLNNMQTFASVVGFIFSWYLFLCPHLFWCLEDLMTPPRF